MSTGQFILVFELLLVIGTRTLNWLDVHATAVVVSGVQVLVSV